MQKLFDLLILVRLLMDVHLCFRNSINMQYDAQLMLHDSSRMPDPRCWNMAHESMKSNIVIIKINRSNSIYHGDHRAQKSKPQKIIF
jgi:hypothetical protein